MSDNKKKLNPKKKETMKEFIDKIFFLNKRNKKQGKRRRKF